MLDADTGHALDDRDEVCGSDCSGDAVTGDGARLEGEGNSVVGGEGEEGEGGEGDGEGEGGRQSPPVHV